MNSLYSVKSEAILVHLQLQTFSVVNDWLNCRISLKPGLRCGVIRFTWFLSPQVKQF